MERAGISVGLGEWALLLLGQWGLAVLVLVAAWLVSGRVFAAAILVGWLGGASGWTAWVNGRRGSPMSRALQKRTALVAGAGSGVISAVLWVGGALAAPEAYGEAAEHLAPGASAALLGAALLGLVLTLCGVNAVNAPWGSLNGGGDSR